MPQSFDTTFSTFKELEGRDSTSPKGFFSAIVSTNSRDRGGDKVSPSAFVNSIADNAKRGRKVKILYNHDINNVLGAVPLENILVFDDRIEIKDAFLLLEIPKAREIYTLLKEGVLTETSVGFLPTKEELSVDGELIITDLEILEFSIVTEPQNQEAVITEVKSFDPKKMKLKIDLENTKWDKEEAIKRVELFTEGKGTIFKKHPYVDVIKKELKIIPKAFNDFYSQLNKSCFKGLLDEDLIECYKNNFKVYGGLVNDNRTDERKVKRDLRDFEDELKERNFSNREAMTFISELKRHIRESDSRSVSKDDTSLRDSISVDDLKNLALLNENLTNVLNQL